MKQYMPMKPVKRGFKVWVRADAVNGYFCDFDVYVGRPGDGTTVETGLGERVVKQLTQTLQGKHYQIFCDNFFSSCTLFDGLLQQGLYACGTTRITRQGYPTTLKGITVERGKQVFCQRGNLVASVWMDKKPVTMLSTLAQPDVERSARRKQKDGSRETVTCSDSVVLYNKYMGGVDKGDQLRQYYRVRSRCMKNYKYIFDFVVDSSITNAFILAHSYSPTTLPTNHQTLKAFRLKLADQLIGQYCTRKKLGRPRSTTDTLSHPPPAVHPTDDCAPLPAQSTRTALHLPSHQKRRRCVYCLKYRTPSVSHQVVWYCKECPGQPALCLTGLDDGSDCFRIWHSAML